MPLYEYHCERCGERFEDLRPAAEREESACPKCGAPARKLVSGFAFGGEHPSGSPTCGTSGYGGG